MSFAGRLPSIVGTITGTQNYSSLGAIDGGHVIVWYSDSTVNEIRAQRYDALGNPAGAEFVVTTLETILVRPSIVGLDNGGFVITWHDTGGSDADDAGVYMQRYNASGVAQGGVDQVNVTVTQGQYNSKTFELPGGYGVAWMTRSSSSMEDEKLFVRLFNNDGTQRTVEMEVNASSDAFYSAMDAIVLTGGNIVVGFSVGGGLHDATKAVVVDQSGTLIGSPTFFDQPGDDSSQLALAALPSGGFVAVYVVREDVVIGGEDSSNALRMRYFDASGNPEGAEIIIAEGPGVGEFTQRVLPDVVATEDGRVLVVWEDRRDVLVVGPEPGSDDDISEESNAIVMMEFGTNRAPIGLAIDMSVNSDIGNIDGKPKIEILPSGDALVTWTGGPVQSDIYQRIVHTAAEGADPRFTGAQNVVTLAPGGERVNAFGGNDQVTGSAVADAIFGGEGEDSLYGLGGDDYLGGGGGIDFIEGGEGDDHIEGGTANDNLEGQAGEDSIFGDDGDDMIFGGDGEDYLIGGTGNDTIDGGDDDDIIHGDINSARMTAALPGGDDVLNGGEGNDELYGGQGDDILNGGDGSDLMRGGDWSSLSAYVYVNGDDTFIISRGADIASGGRGFDTLDARPLAAEYEIVTLDMTITMALDSTNSGTLSFSGGSTIFHSIERILLGAGNHTVSGSNGDDVFDNAFGVGNMQGLGGNDTLTGGISSDTLNGGEGNDVLDGGQGGDTMTGGNGDDIFVVDSFADVVVEGVSGGTDEVRSTLDYTLLTHFENLTLLGSATMGTGNGSANTITGNELDNVLYGLGNADILIGLDGDDYLDGGAGADEMVGGDGDDTYFVDTASDGIDEDFNAGTDLVNSSAATYTMAANVEHLLLIAGGADATGNDLDNEMTGNDDHNDFYGLGGADVLLGLGGSDRLEGGEGDDFLDGGTGNDVLLGGNGNDVFIVDHADDIVTEDGTDGIDEVRSSLASFDLQDDENPKLYGDFENLTLLAGGVDGIGNVLDNVITGNELANTLTGNGGVDHLIGRAGDDVLSGDNNVDTLEGGAGDDTLLGGNNVDTMKGGIGDDHLDGGSGIDIAVYGSVWASYLVTESGGVYTVTDIRSGSPEGTDTLVDVETIRFSDGDFAIAMTPKSAPQATAMTSKTAKENVAFSFDASVHFSDQNSPLGDVLEFSASAPSWLTIDPETGVLSGTPGFFDAAATNVTVTATDADGLATSKTFALTVLDSNRSPTGPQLSKSTVDENRPAGTTVGVLSVIDPDGPAATYTLTSNPGGLFKIAGNQLQTTRALDFEKQVNHKVTIEATDPMGATTTTSFTVGVADVVDLVRGTNGKNTLVGATGADRILGFDEADTLFGKAADDVLEGGDGNDLLIGGGGGDRLVGGKGIDTASYQDATGAVTASLKNPSVNTGIAKGDSYGGVENLTGGAKGDVLNGSDGANVIRGLGGNDTLKGLKGADRLEGGLGQDTKTGGGGGDHFVFRTVKDSPNQKNGFDVITDFSRKQGDRIDLSAIDARTGKKNQAFTFIEDDAFSKTKGELRYEKFAKATFVYGDVNGDGKADLKIQIAKAIDLKLGDFVV
jgi:Ca2+-binding RTX toxin-like protein